MNFGAAIIAVLAVLAGIAPAHAAEPFKDFTFRTVKPPKAGAKKLITIQILPETTEELVKTRVGPLQVAAPANQLDWFWEGVSPDLSAARAGRFQDAVQQLALAPEGRAIATPRIDRFRAIIAEHGSDILLSTIGTKLSPALVLAMISTESGGLATATSDAGAQGLMQLMPDTAARFGVTDTTDPTQNIKGGVAYMEWLLARYNNDPILALAAYNAGETTITDNSGVPPYAETRAYVPKVIAAFQVARALCLTPPELFSDGCVFDLKGGN
jgi:soluble lytic murein transglycosylase-like protein